jgi:hypothetical protein
VAQEIFYRSVRLGRSKDVGKFRRRELPKTQAFTVRKNSLPRPNAR